MDKETLLGLIKSQVKCKDKEEVETVFCLLKTIYFHNKSITRDAYYSCEMIVRKTEEVKNGTIEWPDATSAFKKLTKSPFFVKRSEIQYSLNPHKTGFIKAVVEPRSVLEDYVDIIRPLVKYIVKQIPRKKGATIKRLREIRDSIPGKVALRSNYQDFVAKAPFDLQELFEYLVNDGFLLKPSSTYHPDTLFLSSRLGI